MDIVGGFLWVFGQSRIQRIRKELKEEIRELSKTDADVKKALLFIDREFSKISDELLKICEKGSQQATKLRNNGHTQSPRLRGVNYYICPLSPPKKKEDFFYVKENLSFCYPQFIKRLDSIATTIEELKGNEEIISKIAAKVRDIIIKKEERKGIVEYRLEKIQDEEDELLEFLVKVEENLAKIPFTINELWAYDTRRINRPASLKEVKVTGNFLLSKVNIITTTMTNLHHHLEKLKRIILGMYVKDKT